ncbi:TPA: hypothetical protein NNT57_004638 [Salmonella enterica]|nr:hypothetical protein [Salmonella enterica]HCH9143094.1 hypothetical protein [Salmonella enterica]
MSNEDFDELPNGGFVRADWKERQFRLHKHQEEMIKQAQETIIARKVATMSGREREKLREEMKQELDAAHRKREIWATSNPMDINDSLMRRFFEMPHTDRDAYIQGVWNSRETSLIQRAALPRKPINIPYKVDTDNTARILHLCTLCSRKLNPLHVGSICEICEQRRYVVSQNNERD